MKNLRLNKKGFTLVELLAVIVILALLIVITANTVIPMMSKSKKTGMVTYASRVLENVITSFQADALVNPNLTTKYYGIQEVMGNDNYYGCVSVTVTNAGTSSQGYTVAIKMFDNANNFYLEKTGITNLKVEGDIATLITEYTGTKPSSSDYTNAGSCKDATAFAAVKAPTA